MKKYIREYMVIGKSWSILILLNLNLFRLLICAWIIPIYNQRYVIRVCHLNAPPPCYSPRNETIWWFSEYWNRKIGCEGGGGWLITVLFIRVKRIEPIDQRSKINLNYRVKCFYKYGSSSIIHFIYTNYLFFSLEHTDMYSYIEHTDIYELEYTDIHS